MAQGKGTVMLNSLGWNCIQNVLYVLDLHSNLLSVRQYMLDGYALVFQDSTCYVFKDALKSLAY